MRHEITIRDGVGNYRAVCSCGWWGHTQHSHGAADHEGDDHVVYMTSVVKEDDES